MLVDEVLAFLMQGALYLGQSSVSHAHGLVQGNAAWSMEGGVPHDNFWFPHSTDSSIRHSSCPGCR
jgi:hypothetical protein